MLLWFQYIANVITLTVQPMGIYGRIHSDSIGHFPIGPKSDWGLRAINAELLLI